MTPADLTRYRVLIAYSQECEREGISTNDPHMLAEALAARAAALRLTGGANG
jgi:hypothetical protein